MINKKKKFKKISDLIQVVFYRALASSVSVKDGSLTSRAVTLAHPKSFLGNNLLRVWYTLRNTLRLV